MSDTVLQQVKVDAKAVGDVVELTIGRATARMRYHTAFRVAQDLRVFAKAARSVNNDKEGRWNDVGALNDTNYDSSRFQRYHDLQPSRTMQIVKIISPKAFRGIGLKSSKKILVSLDGQSILLHLGNVTVPFNHDGALKLSTLLRQEGKFAKQFAGDIGKSMSGLGNLHNATPQ